MFVWGHGEKSAIGQKRPKEENIRDIGGWVIGDGQKGIDL
jgi:hypothetical protein